MKIYHLCPSGKLWIFDQKEVSSRKRGEALFHKISNPGDVLKIDIPGQDTIKITKLLNTNNSMGNSKSQVKILDDEKKKDHEKFKENAENFFKEYTALTEKYGVMLDARLEYSDSEIHPKFVLVKKPVIEKEKETAADVTPAEVK